ncbi:MAG: lipid-A-disaccharide synthase N-terminal domain-containing protein [Candidatus Methylomirabilia bacterium]
MNAPCVQEISGFLLALGFLGQAFFSMRFVVQWIVSERKRQSVVPIYFWYFSGGGGLALLTYAILRQDPVFIVGQGAGLFVYARNLYLIWRRGRPTEVLP